MVSSFGFFRLFSRVEIARSLGSVLGLSSKLWEELDVRKCWGSTCSFGFFLSLYSRVVDRSLLGLFAANSGILISSFRFVRE